MLAEYEIFAAVVESGSITAGGRKLGLSPAMASKRIARLEDRLGVRLIERTTRQLSLTEPGRRFYERVVQILDSVGEAESLVSGRLAPSRGVLRVSAPTSFGRMHLAPHLKRFLDANPDLVVEINLTDSFVDLANEGVDVAVRIAALEEPDPDVVWLAPNRRVLCATPGYLAEHGRPEELSDLRGHRLLAAANQSPWRLSGPDGPAALRVRSFVRTNSSEVVRELVLAGVGVALRSTWDVSEELASGALSVVAPRYPGAADVAIHAVRSRRRAASTAVQAFVGFLQTLYGPVPYWESPRSASPRRDEGVPDLHRRKL
jgi:DNA-binding transcriptional LysR family regulator